MVAGQLVFPFIIGVAILFVSGYVVSTPATPAPETNEQRMLRIQPGDQVLLEVTGYYAAPDGKVFFSTQEERRDALPRGDITPQLQESPVTYSVADVTPSDAVGLDKALIGKRPGDKFLTDIIAAENGFGDWEGDKTLTRTVATLPVRVDFTRDTQIQAGRRFNATEYTSFFQQQGYELKEGLVWPCEDPAVEDAQPIHLWECRLVKYDVAHDMVSYERIIEDGTAYPLETVLQVDTVGDTPWNFTVHKTSAGTEFQLRLDPPVGTVFQLKQDLRQPYKAGTYEVKSKTAESLVVRYASTSNVDPRLIGQPIQYDIEILRILRG
jgi:FKBP-type peptidyl-prolyl cis-trans isomerase 2